MENFFDFIINNKELLILIFSVVGSLVSLILYILSIKSAKVKKIYEIYHLLPELINQAESLFPESGSGSKKVSFVFGNLLSRLSVLWNIPEPTLSLKYGALIKDAIEEFLSTPSKRR